MQNAHLLSLNDLPPDGKRLTVDDPSLWAANLREFHMDCRVEHPLKVDLQILPVEDGYLVRGTLTGGVIMPCNRCAEDVHIQLDSRFEEFEEVPDGEEAEDDQPGDSHILLDKGAPMLNTAALCWEEFVLALPMNPLCREDCRGLCPRCGANLNETACTCARDEGDPRLAVLRELSLQKAGQKKNNQL